MTELKLTTVGNSTGLILPRELETPAQQWIEEFGGFNKGFVETIYDLDNNKPEDPLFPYTAGKFGSGANMAFRRTAIEKIGGFDPALGAGTHARGGDDLASFYSVIDAGMQLVYQPSALVWHLHHREYDAFRKTVHGYGVGLGAFITKILVDKPSRIWDVARKLPAGVRYLLAPRSRKNIKKGSDYPRSLDRLERWGLIAGPLAYLRSRWRSRR